MPQLTARNTLYFKAWNEDYRIGGIYYSLDSSEFRLIVILQAYADNEGYIRKSSRKAYEFSTDLADMIGLNYRTIVRALMSLANKGIITVGRDNVIRINRFVDDNIHRENLNKRATYARKQQSQLLNQIATRIDKPIVVDTSTGELLEAARIDK